MLRAYRRPGLLACAGSAAVLTLLPEPGAAQSNAELMAIIREQQRQIEKLSRKVDALQEQAQQATEKADAAAATAEQVAKDTELEIDWGPSPTFRSKDGLFEAHVSGRLFVDGGYIDDEDGFYSNDNATELRAARIGVEGIAWRDWEYKLEVDFADNEVDIADAYIQYDGPVIEPAFVRVGQFKTPNSLEEQTSSRFITFMERAAFTDAFEFERQIGLAAGASGDKLWTLEEFLAFDDGTDISYQLFEGRIVAMNPPLRGHGTLVARLTAMVSSQLKPPCEVVAEAGVIPVNRRHSWYKADLIVTCTPGNYKDQFIAEPVLVVEVLSPTTSATEFNRKLPDHQQMPSMRDILLVSSMERLIRHWRREGDGWAEHGHRRAATFRLSGLPVMIAMRDLYDGILPA